MNHVVNWKAAREGEPSHQVGDCKGVCEVAVGDASVNSDWIWTPQVFRNVQVFGNANSATGPLHPRLHHKACNIGAGVRHTGENCSGLIHRGLTTGPEMSDDLNTKRGSELSVYTTTPVDDIPAVCC